MNKKSTLIGDKRLHHRAIQNTQFLSRPIIKEKNKYMEVRFLYSFVRLKLEPEKKLLVALKATNLINFLLLKIEYVLIIKTNA